MHPIIECPGGKIEVFGVEAAYRETHPTPRFSHAIQVLDPGCFFACAWPYIAVRSLRGELDATSPQNEVRDFLRKVYAFAVALPEGFNLGIHCAEGRQRAPTIALVVLIARGVTLKQALDLVGRAYPDASLSDPLMDELMTRVISNKS